MITDLESARTLSLEAASEAIFSLAGVTLPSGWRCEVIPRKCDLPVRGQDVVFQSPGGATFRSTVDVYHHLGLAAHLPKGHKKRKDRSDDLQVLLTTLCVFKSTQYTDTANSHADCLIVGTSFATH